MFEPIDITPIIKGHLQVVKDNSKPWIGITLFFIIPVALSASLVWFEIEPCRAFLESTLIVFSILIGFTINVIILLFNRDYEGKVKKLVMEVFQTTLYLVALGTIILTLLLAVSLSIKSETDVHLILGGMWYVPFIIYLLIIHYLLTLLLLIKRLYAVIANRN